MATETGDPALAGSKAPEIDQPPQAAPAPTTQPEQPATSSTSAKPAANDAKPAKGSKPAPAAQAGADAESGEKKLTNAELKKKAKEEKAARRAQAKATQPSQQPAGQPGQAAAQGDGKGGQKQRQGSSAGAGGQQQQKGGNQARQTAAAAPVAAAPKEVKPSIPECFSHLSLARRIPITQADKDVDHAVLLLGQHMSSFAISDSITRLETTLHAFKKVIESYTTPLNTTFSRHFTSHVLNPQIEYLTACRPMCFSMGNAIRWLKLQISKIDIDMPDNEAKSLLCELIDNFIRERVNVADQVIVGIASDTVEPSQVILTYAHHHLVERTLLYARASGKSFSVVVVDDPYERVGVEHAKTLSATGIPVTYVSDPGAALLSHLASASVVLLAAEAMFSNGAMYGRAGTSDIAMAARELGVPVTVLCETINFTERVSIDTLTYNEIDPERCTSEGFRLLFDTTRSDFITTIITELGDSSSRSMPSLLRKLEEL